MRESLTSVTISPFEASEAAQVTSLISRSDFECGPDLPTIGICAKLDGLVVGYVGASITYGANAFVHILVVDEVARKYKIGIALIRAIVYHLDSLGVKRIEANVEEDNFDALNLFKEIGMEFRPIVLIEAPVEKIKNYLDDHQNRERRELPPTSQKGSQTDS
jgi:GNAT superfamily N-acetyltransferase